MAKKNRPDYKRLKKISLGWSCSNADLASFWAKTLRIFHIGKIIGLSIMKHWHWDTGHISSKSKSRTGRFPLTILLTFSRSRFKPFQ